jgi:hypothetical protein
VVSGSSPHRADAIVLEDIGPFHPWFLDFVQAQIDSPEANKVLVNINRSYQLKISILIRDHESVPRSSIIPMAFASNGVFHPSSLVFIDWFLCRASREPVKEPPAFEKLKIL